MDHKFPVELNLEGALKILNMGKLVCIYRDNALVFVVRIPLVYNENFTLYHLISLPVTVANNSAYMIIEPNKPYLAVSKNYEKYMGFDEVDIQECRQTPDFMLCEGDKIIYNRHERSVCEIQLIMKPERVPESCMIRFINGSENIFLKLKYKNIWLYSTKLNSLVIDCEREINPITIEIKGIGLLTLRND